MKRPKISKKLPSHEIRIMLSSIHTLLEGAAVEAAILFWSDFSNLDQRTAKYGQNNICFDFRKL